MYEDLIFPLLVLIFVLFVIAGPVLLYNGFLKLASPVPLYLPVLITVLCFLLLTGIQVSGVLNNAGVVAGTLAVFSLMFFIVTLAVVTPYCYFGRTGKTGDPWISFSLLAFMGNCLFFFTTMGHAFEGRPLPLFGSRMPGSGNLLDAAISALDLGDFVYAFHSPVYSAVLAVGLYIDVFVVSALYFGMLSLLPAPAASQEK